MKLGEMLVRDGRLTEAQLQHALQSQAKDGGRLGTVLFELGFIDLEALTVYLGLELGIPIATGAMLERAKRAAVRLLQPQQAFKHKVVPLVLQDRQLIAAVEDPHDFAALEALTALTGYRVLPRVAPEVRIYYYIERYYGVARPPRFLKFADTPRGNETAVDVNLPAPPLPGLPPVPQAVIAAPGPKPHLRSTKLAQMFDDSEALELEAEDLLDSLDADTTAPAEPTAVTIPPPMGVSGVFTIPTELAPKVPPIHADAALRELAGAADRNRIIEILLGFAADAFVSAVVFTVRDNMAFGWKAIGDIPGHANVEHLLVPLEAPSVLQAVAVADTGVWQGVVTPSTVNAHLFKVLGMREPLHAAAGVIAIGKRVVNILLGVPSGSNGMTPLQLDVLQQVMMSGAEAYARLIAVSKRRK
ncbi:MAG: hypothetical protein NT062_07675 [Proteobacteria bacterium]|nr:hypothetical protein [Pseudomonadota bacterium]